MLMRWCVIALVFSGLSCDNANDGSSASHRLAVRVATDLQPGVEFDTAAIIARDSDSPVSANVGDHWEAFRTIGAVDVDAGPASLQVVLRLAGRDVLSRLVTVNVTESTSVSVVLVRRCTARDCPPADSADDVPACHGDRCVADTCNAEHADDCGPAQCAVDSDCVANVSCIRPICLSGACLELADDLACPPSATCDPVGGCITPNVASSCAGKPAGETCRAAQGACDAPETCDGVSDECPTDTFLPATATCRAASDLCDLGEVCTGSGPECPLDRVRSANEECRAQDTATLCDTADVCDGVTKACVDSVLPLYAVCRSAVGTCDNQEFCNGETKECPVDSVLSAGAACRSSAGDCDIEETCNGTSGLCPSDARKPIGTICRTGDLCDPQEVCQGDAACPPNVISPSGTVCRASAGDCDAAEVCDGVQRTCSDTDAKRPAGSKCRDQKPDTSPNCDAGAEYCDGINNECPAETVFKSRGTQCKAAGGDCDPADWCTGSSSTCPTYEAPTGGCCEKSCPELGGTGEPGQGKCNSSGVCSTCETLSSRCTEY